jgi:hypothetical protein
MDKALVLVSSWNYMDGLGIFNNRKTVFLYFGIFYPSSNQAGNPRHGEESEILFHEKG